LLGCSVDQVVGCRDGSPARVVAPDPRWFPLLTFGDPSTIYLSIPVGSGMCQTQSGKLRIYTTNNQIGDLQGKLAWAAKLRLPGEF
jgi:hypothetical protein